MQTISKRTEDSHPVVWNREVLRLSVFVLSHMVVFIIESILLGDTVHRDADY